MKLYYYLNSQGQQMPPVDFESLSRAGINASTMVWFEGLHEWKPAGEIPELQPIVATVPPSYQSFNQNPAPSSYPQQQSYQPQYQQPSQPKPQSYLWLGICTTILCCLPAGIASIVYATKVDTYWSKGMYNEANNSSEKAKTWGLVSAGVGVLMFGFTFLLALVG